MAEQEAWYEVCERFLANAAIEGRGGAANLGRMNACGHVPSAIVLGCQAWVDCPRLLFGIPTPLVSFSMGRSFRRQRLGGWMVWRF